MELRNFAGISNTSPARSIKKNELADATDVIIEDSGAVRQRDGYTQALALANTTSYQTFDGVTYVVSGGILYRMNADLTKTAIVASTATEFCDESRYLFTNDGVQVHNGVPSSINIPTPQYEPQVTVIPGTNPAGLYTILCTHSNSQGVEGGTSPPLSARLSAPGDLSVTIPALAGHTANVYVTDADGEVFYLQGTRFQLDPILVNANPFPTGADKIEYFNTRMYVSVPQGDYTTVFYSEPNHYHLYGFNDAYFVVTGKVEAMKATQNGIVIATNSEVYFYDGIDLVKIADYGVVPGRPIVRKPDKSLLIHTTRGVCSAMPFTELTQAKVSLPMGGQCSAALMYVDGAKLFVGLHDGSGTAFNKT